MTNLPMSQPFNILKATYRPTKKTHLEMLYLTTGFRNTPYAIILLRIDAGNS